MPDFDADRDQVVARARDAGVSFVEAGFDVASSRRALVLARELGGKCAAGIHPHNLPGSIQDTEIAWSEIESLLRGGDPQIVAVGETGLDFSRGSVDKDAQIDSFSRGVDLACRLGLPLIVHEREAEEAAIGVLRRFALSRPVIFHCFTGGWDYARRCLDQGGFMGFGGIVTYPRNSDLREVLKMVPGDRLLLETDAPYLAPQAHRGKRNEPAFVVDSRDLIARVLEMPPEEVSRITTANSRVAFGADPVLSR